MTAAQRSDARTLQKLVLSAAAASAAETATFPLDLLKTRLQLAGQSLAAGAAPPGLAATAAQLVRAEGVAGLYAGLAPAVLRHIPYTSIRVLVFEHLRGAVQRRAAAAQQPGGPPPQVPLPVSLAIGLTAGSVAQLVAVPADLVKVRMQADGRLVAAGLQAAPRWVPLPRSAAATGLMRSAGSMRHAPCAQLWCPPLAPWHFPARPQVPRHAARLPRHRGAAGRAGAVARQPAGGAARGAGELGRAYDL